MSIYAVVIYSVGSNIEPGVGFSIENIYAFLLGHGQHEDWSLEDVAYSFKSTFILCHSGVTQHVASNSKPFHHVGLDITACICCLLTCVIL